ncbi:general transcription factor IIIC subunit 5 [Rhinolophus ferrumequinum]|uniref:General transcription factor IIIC subunit 5 n=1 Tax=Rhinolophus ferrumequinum TaxID=59479 RepID=A0A7J7VQC1_RHIFE|nr:general transcription factor IIIC subunit 5 [Rhinolophus ferrumequinum]
MRSERGRVAEDHSSQRRGRRVLHGAGWLVPPQDQRQPEERHVPHDPADHPLQEAWPPLLPLVETSKCGGGDGAAGGLVLAWVS